MPSPCRSRKLDPILSESLGLADDKVSERIRDDTRLRRRDGFKDSEMLRQAESDEIAHAIFGAFVFIRRCRDSGADLFKWQRGKQRDLQGVVLGQAIWSQSQMYERNGGIVAVGMWRAEDGRMSVRILVAQ